MDGKLAQKVSQHLIDDQLGSQSLSRYTLEGPHNIMFVAVQTHWTIEISTVNQTYLYSSKPTYPGLCHLEVSWEIPEQASGTTQNILKPRPISRSRYGLLLSSPGCCVDWNLQTLAIERTRDPKNWGQLSQIGLEKTDLELSRNHPLKRNSYRTSCKRYLKSLWNHQYPPTPPEKRRLRHPLDCLRIENCREFPPFFWTKISDFWKHLTCSLRYWLQADTDPHQVLRPQR